MSMKVSQIFAHAHTIWNTLLGLSRGSPKLARCGFLGLALIACVLGNEVFAAPPFDPVRKLTTWYTDRNPIDVEVVATSGASPDARFLGPRRALGLRLERAYVGSIGWHEQPDYDYSSLSMSFDAITGLPSALFSAPPLQVDKRGEDIPQLTHDESIRRTLIVNVDGHSTAENLKTNSKKLDRCRGAQERDDLFRLNDDGSTHCHLSSLIGKMNYVALLSADVSVQITCTDQAIGCRLMFPFDGFAPVVVFHRNRLGEWRSIIDEASAFLRAKKYQQ